MFRVLLPNFQNLNNVHSIQLNLRWAGRGIFLIVRSIKTSHITTSQPKPSTMNGYHEILYELPASRLRSVIASIPLLTNTNKREDSQKHSIRAFVGGIEGRRIDIARLSIRYLIHMCIDGNV